MMKTVLSICLTLLITPLTGTVSAAKNEPVLPGSCRIGHIACESGGSIMRSEKTCVVKSGAKRPACGKNARYSAKKGIDICSTEKKVKEASCKGGYVLAIDPGRRNVRDLCYKKVRAYICSWNKTKIKGPKKKK